MKRFTPLKVYTVAGILLTGSLSACFRKAQPDAGNGPPPTQTEAAPPPGVLIPSGSLPQPSSSGQITYMGGIITTRVIAGRTYIPIEAVLSDGSFAVLEQTAGAQAASPAERTALIGEEVATNISAIKRSVSLVNVEIKAELGFFTAHLALDDYPTLASITGLTQQFLINPVLLNAGMPTIPGMRSVSDTTLGVPSDRAADPRASNDAFSGLERIGVKEFLAATQAELGEEIDGSLVSVGIADSGLTLNHPAFEDAQGQSRITYMKDFTGEGQIYFADTGSLEAREPTATELKSGVSAAETIVVSAKYILTPIGREVPVADALSSVESQVFQVPAALKTALLTPGSGARLGVLSETAFSNELEKEFVDINHNGKNDDLLWAILLPHTDVDQAVVYLDLKGKGDFRTSPALRSWNASKATITSFAEKFGLDIKSVKLHDAAGKEVNAVAAAVVGFDPGNHGSHVAGIIAARKTIANDDDNTMARGVAPNTKVMLNRVCAQNGGCVATQAIIDLAEHGAEVINMSLGGLNPWNDGYGVQETVVNRLSQLKNTLFVISAGNSGPGRQTVGSPSVAQKALSVAAAATPAMVSRLYQYPGSGKIESSDPKSKDFVLFFSSRGPTEAGGFKPNIAAPGTELSTVQLNAPVGSRTGLDVYWGTSMAAPTASGAAALLIDAAKRYNAKNPSSPLPLDSATLHRVISQSARPFDVSSFDPKTGKRSVGQYTWIDQGHGMFNLPAAWKALKRERDGRLPSAVSMVDGGGTSQSLPLEYEVRVLRKSPNGNDYTGSVQAPIGGTATEPRLGRGIYLSMKDADSLIGVQVVRKLPLSAQSRADAGELYRQLVTTADTFEIETVMYGSAAKWISAGTLARLDCLGTPTSKLTVIGTGPTDKPDGSAPLAASTLMVCVDRKLTQTLPAGDHGAIIKGFRVVNGKREVHPSFEVPVYLSVPHATVAGQAGYKIERSVKSFGVVRNYVEIPSGVSLVKVTLEVPPAIVSGNDVTGCAGVEAMILEGGNTAKPAELLPRAKAQVSNCDKTGALTETRSVTLTRLNPTAGVWDVHVFGQYNYADSQFKLTVDFANIASSVTKIEGSPSALNGSLEFEIREASILLTPSDTLSSLSLTSLVQHAAPTIAQDQSLRVPTIEGVVARTYAEDIGSVSFSTGGLPGNDLDLSVLECADETLTVCKEVAQSAGATDVELATFTPVKGKFYVPEVVGYTVSSTTPVAFEFSESRNLIASDQGQVKTTALEGSKFKVDYSFDVASSKILALDLFQSGQWAAGGELKVASADGGPVLRIPVEVKKP